MSNGDRVNRGWVSRVLVALAACLAVGLLSTSAALAQSRTTIAGTAAPGQTGTSRTGNLASTSKLTFVVTLPLRHQSELRSLVAAVSTPGSVDYGHYLTPAQFAARFAPTAAQVSNVTSYLRSQGISVTGVSSNRAVIDATGSTAAAQRAFGTTIGRYYDPRLNRHYYANDHAVALPAAVAPDVLAVVGLDNHFVRRHPPVPRSANPLAGGGPAGGYTPAQLKTGYDVAPLASAGYTGSGQKVGLFELAGFKQANITAYDNQYSLGSPAPSVVSVDGGNSTLGNAEVEVELDIEVVQAMAPKANITVWEGPNSDKGVIDTYNAMATSNTTPANSTSWGECEPDATTATINSESQIYSQMAAQGQTLYAASGDSAAYDCGTQGQLAVDNPADDPNVTGAGGTRLVLSSTNAYSSETPWDTNATEGGGGGVSTIFAKPSWQTAPGMPSNCASKRCVPDISLDADPATGYSIYTQGSWTVVGGTSAAAPMWAGFTAVYNQDATANSKPRLGYANPALYRLASNTQTYAPFHDITTGHTSTSTNWPAKSGYDLATGIGSYDAYDIARDLIGGSTPTNDFSIKASPASVTVQQGSGGSSTISTAVTSGSAQSVSLSASGLPSGATATFSPTSVTAGGSSTMSISTSASTPSGTYSVTVTGTGSSATHSTTVSLTVNGSSTQVQVVKNPGFETGTAAPWSLSTGVLNNSSGEPPHAGSWDAWMDGYGTTHTDTASQSVTIPAGKSTAKLSFYLHVDTAETTTTTAYDKLTVKLGSTTLATYSNLNHASGYVVHSFTVSQFIGQTVKLSFTGTEDSSLQTSFVLDDIKLTAS